MAISLTDPDLARHGFLIAGEMGIIHRYRQEVDWHLAATSHRRLESRIISLHEYLIW
jgi:hypothetical protein